MKEAGIWRPKFYPSKWIEVIENPSHPLSIKLSKQFKSKCQTAMKDYKIENPIIWQKM